MNNFIFKVAMIVFSLLIGQLFAQTPKVRIDKSNPKQKITGFGGFVCSPQFGYNHMSTEEIQKMWGENSEAGYNIMRLYIPSSQANWSVALETAQLAKSMGLILFASPWSPPAEWKTNGNEAGTYDGVEGFLKPEHYGDYANYLNNFVVYLRDNGVELDYISIQNEPDYIVTYSGCSWTPEQIATFLRDYSDVISCKIIVPETVGMPNTYVNALSAEDVLPKFEVYGGHQYGTLQNGYQNLSNFNKQIWMTEYLINWNTNSTRDFDWSIDAFDFAKSINTIMLGNGNAWVHYATKRYYGMMGDGLYGTAEGDITKRGYVLSHFAKNVTGLTRVDAVWSDQEGMEGSSYINDLGDKVVLIVINSGSTDQQLKVDLPFFTNSAEQIVTSASINMEKSPLSFDESFRPIVEIGASTVNTFIFYKTSDRPVSEMLAQEVNYNTIENQISTNSAFGTGYQLSGKSNITLYNSTPLISSNTTDENGYLALDDRYNKLVFHVNSYTTSNLPTSANTTLYYVDNAGVVKSHNYGTVNLPTSGSTNFDLVFDISREVLPSGIKGIIGLRNGNYSSILTFNFGDVYFNIGTEQAMKFTGSYSNGDSNLMDAYENSNYTSLDFRSTSEINTVPDWSSNMSNKNSIFYVNEALCSRSTLGKNIIAGTVANLLELSDYGKDFNVPFEFNTTSAKFTVTLDGYKVLSLPFESAIPEGVVAYRMAASATEVRCTQIVEGMVPANTPILVDGEGTFVFEGSGDVSTPKNYISQQMVPVYISHKSPVGGYIYKNVDGVEGFYKVQSGATENLNPFTAYLTADNTYTEQFLPIEIETLSVANPSLNSVKIYPVPVKNELFVDNVSENTLLQLFNSNGSLLISKELNSGKNALDVSAIPAGMYIIKLISNQQTITRKIVKY